jgi:hypothetical protein
MIAQLEEAKTKVESVFKEQTEMINRNWDRTKLAIVPGDILLDTVFREYGLRFVKERDGARIASLMMEDEIEHEIKSLLREIGM